MRIIVVADTHRNFERYNNIVDKNEADLFIHLGDGSNEFADVAKLHPNKKFLFVKGEGDFCEASLSRTIELEKCKLFCTHGHLYDVSDGLEKAITAAKEEGCNILLYGHTHLYRAELIDGIYVLNPGSLGIPRGHNKPSYGVLDISAEGKVEMNIVAY